MRDLSHPHVGKRIRLLKMGKDPHPIPAGTTGTVVSVCHFVNNTQVMVKWDIDRSLALICPPDEYELLKEG